MQIVVGIKMGASRHKLKVRESERTIDEKKVVESAAGWTEMTIRI